VEKCRTTETIREMKRRKTLWRLFAKALGEKASKCDRESDAVAVIRAIIVFTYLITNSFIVVGVIRHWNDNQSVQVSSNLPETQKEIVLKTSGNFSYD
jgi:hypothetical protein